MGEGRSELIENPSAHSFGPSSHGERPPGRPSGHLAQHAGSDQPGSEIQPGAGRDIEPLGEQASGDQRLAQRDGAGRVQRERPLAGSAAIRRAAACSRASSRAPRRAASARQSR